jgi:protein-tyrosine phosphatase
VKVLFVCNANIVRSFMAERLLRSRLKRAGLEGVDVSSAGGLDMRGAPADERARQVLRENGIEDEGHRSRVVDEAIIGEADLILAMEQRQLQIIGERYPFAAGKARMLKSCLPKRGDDVGSLDIRDPYGRSLFDYRLCFAEISLAMEELMKCI